MEGSVMSINWSLLVQAVNFLIFMVLINKFLFQPVLTLMEKREEELNVHYSEVENLKQKAEKLLNEVEEILNEARAKAKEINDETIKKASMKREEVLKKAHEEASAKIDKAKQEIWSTLETEKAKIESEAGKLADEIVRKFVGGRAA